MWHGNQYLIPLLGPILRTCLQSHLQTPSQPLISHECNIVVRLKYCAWVLQAKQSVYLRYWFERSASDQRSKLLVRAACVHCHGTKCPLLMAFLVQAACMRCHRTKCLLLSAFFLVFFFISFRSTYFSFRRGYLRVLKFSGVLTHRKNKILGETKFGGPSGPFFSA